MPVASSDTTGIRAEKALAGYLRGHRDSNSDDETYADELDLDCNRAGDLEGVSVHEGRQTQTLETPFVVVAEIETQRLFEGADWYDCSLEVILGTNRQEDDDDTKHAEVVHAARAKAIDDLLYSEDVLKKALNKPGVGADTRAVDEFNTDGGGVVGKGQKFDVESGVLYETWAVDLNFCMPGDPV